ncbi:hypothetical protein Ciccas_013727 [Cichlidogyrus casuarinus]|uniref:Uncharacterized protein n=1 Tax=Cichlidogyrus casuarinus TaxID=1844966 RepID=A0ABD2PJX7_9PLAT
MLCCRGPKPVEVFIKHGSGKQSEELAKKSKNEMERIFKDKVRVTLKSTSEDIVSYRVGDKTGTIKDEAGMASAVIHVRKAVNERFMIDDQPNEFLNGVEPEDVSAEESMKEQGLQKEPSTKEETVAGVTSITTPSNVNEQNQGNPPPRSVEGASIIVTSTIDFNQRDREGDSRIGIVGN